MTQAELDEKMSLALIVINRTWPYLAPAVMRLRKRWCEEVPTIGVDKHWRMYANPDWVEKTSLPHLALIIAGHEVQHLLHKHHSRFRDAHPDKANVAEDLAINCDLEGFCDAAEKFLSSKPGGKNHSWYMEFTLPEEGWYPHKCKDEQGNVFPDKLTAEEYYALLPPVKHIRISCPCGSGAANPQPWEDPAGEGDGVSDAEVEAIAKAVAEEAMRHEAKYPGTVPAGLKRELGRTLAPPRVPWQRKLNAAVRQQVQAVRGKFDYSYARANRRPSGRVVLPGMIDYRPRIAIVVDTSGSMGADQLLDAVSEAAGAVEAAGGEAWLLFVDAAVAEPVRVRNRADVARAVPVGGGGTDMRVGIRAAAALKPRASTIVVISDGYSPWNMDPIPGTKLFVVLVCPGAEKGLPAWAEYVVLDDYEQKR